MQPLACTSVDSVHIEYPAVQRVTELPEVSAFDSLFGEREWNGLQREIDTVFRSLRGTVFDNRRARMLPCCVVPMMIFALTCAEISRGT
jgi:hypothetical protein